VLQRAVKWQALVHFLVDHLFRNEWELNDDLPEEEVFLVNVMTPWEMCFDGDQ